MPQSLANVVLHLVFSTKNRTDWLTPEIREELFPYFVGILKSTGCTPIQVGGHIDHAHLLFSLARTKSIAQVVEEVKTGSSKWLKTKGVPLFSWQSGYAVFSVSMSGIDAAVAYVRDQEEHHRKVTFMDEFRALMAEAEIEIDERYVWD
jgi:REP element-mobilizing transposase RayT